MKDNSNKGNVLITGGSSGIGEAMVKAFAEQGYAVWFTYRSGKNRAENLVKILSQFSVTALELDQSKPESITELLRQLPGKIDILINNAAVGTRTVEKIAKTEDSQDMAFFQVNAIGPLWLTMKILPTMKKDGSGKIIFVSSVDGGVTHFPKARYADGMSKAALTHFVKQLAAELVSDPIDIYAICPGATETPMFTASTLAKLSDQERQNFLSSLPGKRLIDPDEIARLALFLCSKEGALLRGSVIDASMGLGNNPFSVHSMRGKR